MPKFYVMLLALLGCSSAFAQNSITFKGKVLDGKSQVPMEAVTVYIASAADSTVVDYTITDKSGTFVLNTRKTDKPMIFKVSFIGFKIIEKAYDKGLTSSADFGILRLEEDANLLGEVVIKQEAPPIRIKNDTLEFNAASFKVRPDANVETLLKQLPGVEIDNEGKITVNGKEVNQILVNGKPFFDKEGKVALQNLPSDIINKVQITDTKTKKEELSGEKASSNNASINLTIDEDKNKGYFGKATAGYGTDERYEGSLMLNYFNNKRRISILGSTNNINSTGFTMNEIFDSMGGGRAVSIWTSDNGSFGINGMRFGGGNGITRSNLFGLNYGDEPVKDLTTNGSYFFNGATTENENRTREVKFLPTGENITESQSKTEDEKSAHNASFEIEYKLDSLTTVSIQPKFTSANSKFKSRTNQFTINETGQLANESDSDNDNTSDSRNFSTNLYLNRAFKKQGRFLSVWGDLSLNNENAENRQISENIFYSDTDNDGILDTPEIDNRNQRRFDRNTSDTYSINFNYTEPLKDSIGFSVGFEYRTKRDVNDRDAFDFDAATQTYSIANDALTNYLTSGTTTATPKAGFFIRKKVIDISVSLGTDVTRFENFSNYLGVETVLNKTYMLPSANMWGSINFSKKSSIWLNYSYEVNFPSPSQILPVEDISNPLHTFSGNPELDPNQSHYFYIGYRNYDFATKSGFSLYAGGNSFESQIVSSTTYDESGKGFTTYENISGNLNSWFGGNWNRTIKREAHSFRFGFGANASFNRNQGFTNGELYDSKGWRVTPRVNFNYDYGELVSIGPRYEFTYSDTQYENYRFDKQTNLTHRFTLQTTTYWPKHVVFGNDFSYTYNSNIADGFKKDFYLWNLSLGYNFFGDKLLAKVKVYDMLNQNQNATRSISATSLRDEENIVLKRYAMFSLTYKLDKFAGKKPEGRRFWMHD